MRAAIVFGFVLLALLGGAGRLVFLELREGPRLRQRAIQQQTVRVILPAQRGDILDCRGRVLAGSVQRPSVYADPALVSDFAFEAGAVAEVLGLDAFELQRRLLENRTHRFLWVKRFVSDEEAAAFERVRRRLQLRAFALRYEPKRVYPCRRLAAHVLGFVDPDERGLAGIEYRFDQDLRGKPGQRISTVDARRRRVRSLDEGFVPPRDGAAVVLTLDAHLQQRVEEHLSRTVQEYEAQWGTAILMDPRSGEVLAMAVVPGFDPAEPIPPGLEGEALERARERLRNRAIADAFEPGSVFKPFVAAAALDAGLVQLDEPFAIGGPARSFGGRVIHDVHAYGRLALYEIISKSSNIGMGLVGARCGNERLYEFVRRFGFGDPTGIELPGEHDGLVQDISRWNRYSTQSVPIGQEVAATALQILTGFCVLCNDGLLVRPRVVRGVVAADGRTLRDTSRPIVVRRVLDAETARAFRMQALVAVVREGTGRRAQLERYQVFGKTGTAQIARPDGGGYMEDAYVATFVGGAPARDPRLAVIVTVYRPTSGKSHFGGTVAAPAARDILRDALEYLRIAPEIPQNPAPVARLADAGG